MEPINVITISNINKVRKLPAKNTSRLDKIVKNLIFLNAQTTAKVKNKQDNVLKSKYSKYSLSGKTKKLVTIANNAAIQKTIFFLIKYNAFKSSPR